MNRNRRLLVGTTSFVLATALLGGLGFWWYESTRPEHRLRQGQAALLRGDFDRAEGLADKLLSAGYPDHAHLLKGQVYLHSRPVRLNPAIEEYNQIRPENEPILAEASVSYGLGLLSLNLQARAEKLFLYVVEVQPDNVDARRGLAVIYFDRGAMNLALKQLTRWSQLDDSDGQPHRFMGVIYKDSMAEELSIKEFQAALERRLPAPTREEVAIDLAEVFLKRTQSAEALACLEQSSFETFMARALEVRAAALYNLNRGPEAAEVLEPLLRVDPPSPRALRYRALIYIDAGDTSAAVPLLEKAVRVDPHEAECRYQLAMLYERLGRRKEAAEQRRLLDETQMLIALLSNLNREANQKPTDLGVRRRLADVCEQLGKFDLAQSWRRAEASCRPENQAEQGRGEKPDK